ncbi:translation initiation factor eIF-2B subunit epsilon [Myriangium duriaei CBS 260.36]|uniref:Mannose-1-phosphate guanyltransferase n=1 Tax=Myriangium duriaei CBS 260.36 TaxID=1168546 RepID=A0A9P4J1Y1_9PEZI|nr:translation initiation factor eIF-2B subunit epsilon [Myriangium duriaei CBS 260.36]
MPPKPKKGGDKGRGEAEEVEEPLQAVVFADSFETRFNPLTLEKPRCLLPLANTPLIEYTLEFLVASGVQEVYFYCGAHTAQLEDYLSTSKWTSRTSPFDVFEILRSTSNSIGDAMRDLDKRAMLGGDFLVVYGDIISNLTLAPALAAHKARKAVDKNSIMTMLLRQAGMDHRSKAQDMLSTFVIDPSKQRCLAYEQISQGSESKMLELDTDILAEEELEIRTDLIDCGIDICTPDVLALWSDNFDYEAPRRGFLHSVLKDYELNGKKIHTYIEQEGYAARVRDLRSYDAICKDVLGRWTYPFTPDSNFGRDQTYRLYKGGCYREEGVVLAGSCEVGKKTVIGRASAVGDGSVIENSVIGRRCIIGRNVKISGSYVWDDATIGDGCTVVDGIIASEASLGKKVTISPGAVISFGCHIADGITVPERTRITRMKKSGGLGDEELVRGDPDVDVVGKGGEGFRFIDEDEDEDEEVLGLGPRSLYSFAHLSVSQESISTLNSQDMSSEDMRPRTVDSRSASFGSVTSDEGSGTKNAMDFHHEASVQIYESLQKGDESANMQLELTSLRMAADASPHSVRKAVIVAFMKRIAALVESGVSPAQAVKQTIPAQENLLKRTMFDHGEKHEEKPDQLDFLLLMQADLRHRKDGEKIMLHASNELVMQDIVETEGFEQWWENEKSTDGEDMIKIRSMMQPFMDAIAEDDESEDEEDSEEDE